MPVSLDFLRGLLGGLSLFFAHFLGRAIVKVSKGRERKRALYMWTLRFALTVGAVVYRSVDRLAIIILALDVAAFAVGWWDEWRPKHEEDLTHTIFPEDR